MSTAVLSLGSNLGDRRGYLQHAITRLGKRVTAVSAVFESDPWETTGPEFYNVVAVVSDPQFTAHDWLETALRIESEAARTRTIRWGPRTLDIDVIVCEDGTGVQQEIREEFFLLPHPRAYERAFVLLPWITIQPDAYLSLSGQKVAVRDLIDQLSDKDHRSVRETSWTLTTDTQRNS